MPFSLKSELKDHQIEGVLFALSHHYSGNFLRMGQGKSLIALTTALHTGPTIIVCPAYLRINWAREIEKHTSEKYEIVTSKNFRKLDPTAFFHIVSYDGQDYAFEMLGDKEMLIIDEAHSIKTPSTKRTKKLTNRVKKGFFDRVLMLTGTPQKNAVWDYLQLMRVCSLNPKGTSGLDVYEYFSSIGDFKNHFCKVWTDDYGHDHYYGFKNGADFKAIYKDKFFNIETPSSVKTLEEYVAVDYKAHPDEEAMWQSFLNGELEGEHVATVKKYNAIQKTKFTCEVVKNLLETTEESVVIFTDHRDSAKEIADFFGVRPIIGGASDSIRDEIVQDFENGKSRIIVGTIGAMSTGLNLVRACYMVFNDSSWSNTDMEQARGRIDRIGQLKTCTYIYIVGSHIDENLTRTINKKDKDVESVQKALVD